MLYISLDWHARTHSGWKKVKIWNSNLPSKSISPKTSPVSPPHSPQILIENLAAPPAVVQRLSSSQPCCLLAYQRELTRRMSHQHRDCTTSLDPLDTVERWERRIETLIFYLSIKAKANKNNESSRVPQHKNFGAFVECWMKWKIPFIENILIL